MQKDNYYYIKDDNNFLTSSKIKVEELGLYLKNKNKYNLNIIINNAHYNIIKTLILTSNGNLISC